VKRFIFKLEPLLKLRRSQRDACRQLLADVLARDRGLAASREATLADRSTQIAELRNLGSVSHVDVDASAARRHYAVQLSGRLGEIDSERAALSRQVDLCRQALVRADQAVKSLEKLAERQLAEFVERHERVESRELEQAWQAIHAGEAARC